MSPREHWLHFYSPPACSSLFQSDSVFVHGACEFFINGFHLWFVEGLSEDALKRAPSTDFHETLTAFPFFRSSIHNLVFIIEMEASTSASFYEYRVNRDCSRIPTVILTRYFIQCTWFPKNATQSANRTSAVVACWNNQSLPFNRHKQFFIQLFFSLYIVLSIAPVYGGNHFRPKSISIETIARVQQQYLGGKLSADMKWVIINFRRKSYKKPTHTHSACQRFFQRINISIFLKHHLVKCHALRVDMMWTEGFFSVFKMARRWICSLSVGIPNVFSHETPHNEITSHIAALIELWWLCWVIRNGFL